jgi:peptidoglycan/LPS O-acetylase OafA/YrhL
MQRELPTRLDSLTGLRFFAAWLVVAHHFSNFSALPFLWRYTGFGATGVTFFFVLSGFVLTWSFVPSDTAPRFYWRRFARIVPLHLVTTAIALPVFYTWRDVPYDWSAITLSFLLLHAWVPYTTTYFAGNPASWSLSCEMFFYALHPILVRGALALKLIGLALLSVAVLFAIFVVARWSPEWFSARVVGWLLYISPLFRVGEFLLGIGLAAAMKRGFRVPVGVIPGVILVALWFHLEYRLSPQYFHYEVGVLISNLSYVVLPLLYGTIIAAVVQLDFDGARSVLRTKTMVSLGQWSYALYLIHASVIYVLLDLYGPQKYQMLESTLWFGLVTILSIGASAVLYTVIEHPIEQRLRQLQRTWIARRQPAAVTAATPTPAPAKTSTTDA